MEYYIGIQFNNGYLMKNFKKDFLESEENFTHANLSKSPVPVPQFEEPKGFQALKSTLARLFSPLILSSITSPMNVGSILLQVSNITKTSPIEHKSTAQPTKVRFIQNGIYGDNIMFRPQPVQGYRSLFQKIGREGIRGFYKGNFTGFLFLTSNVSLRNYIFNEVSKQKDLSSYIQSLATVVVCAAVDTITYPLMTAQSRLILQNSNPNFRTYKSCVDIFRKTPIPQLFQGASLTIPKNLFMFAAWFNFLQTTPQLSFMVSTFLSHLVTYPFTTVMRRMQVQSAHPMMYDEKKSVRTVVKELWGTNKIRGFYQGFLAYSVIHGATTGLMLVMNTSKQKSFSMN